MTRRTARKLLALYLVAIVAVLSYFVSITFLYVIGGIFAGALFILLACYSIPEEFWDGK